MRKAQVKERKAQVKDIIKKERLHKLALQGKVAKKEKKSLLVGLTLNIKTKFLSCYSCYLLLQGKLV